MAADARADDRQAEGLRAGHSAAPDTIFAVSSGAAPAAIAIVRISGPRAGAALEHLAGGLPPPRRASLRPLHAADGELLDRALLLWFPGRTSATGEDLAELHLHGGKAIVGGVLRALGQLAGLRLAEPGEFTRRAFENERIDLAQAEGLADLLAAETDRQRRHALRIAEGGLGRLVEQWRDAVLGLAARIEAQIEFGEEGDVSDDPALASDVAILHDAIGAALASPPAERLRDGVRIVIAGPPNAGKSTLINALAGRLVALATPIPGTTRDLLEAPVVLGGCPCVLVDSAGLRDTEDALEALGIARAEEAIASADLVLWLGQPAERPGGAVIVVAAKADLEAADLPAGLRVSALTGLGMAELTAEIERQVVTLLPAENAVAFAARQRSALAAAQHCLAVAVGEIDPVLQAASLAAARSALDGVTGRAGVEDMLDVLFGRFCIGK